jgi:hypothetical protein
MSGGEMSVKSEVVKRAVIVVATVTTAEVTLGVLRGLKVRELVAAKVEQITNGDSE